MSNTRRSYPSDLSNKEWELIRPLVPAAKPGGRPRSTDMRELLNSIFYVAEGGIKWSRGSDISVLAGRRKKISSPVARVRQEETRNSMSLGEDRRGSLQFRSGHKIEESLVLISSVALSRISGLSKK